jgi:hypothetical protein
MRAPRESKAHSSRERTAAEATGAYAINSITLAQRSGHPDPVEEPNRSAVDWVVPANQYLRAACWRDWSVRRFD